MRFLALARRVQRAPGALALSLASLASRLPASTPALAGAAALVAVTGAAVEADASLHLEVTLDHLVTLTDMAVEATPQESRSVWENIPGGGRRIVTYTRLSVSQAAYGNPSGDVWVRTLGGQVGDIGQKVEGEAVLAPSERSVLFLKKTTEGPFRVAEMAQGQFLVRRTGPDEKLTLSPYLGRVLPSKDEKARSRAARVLLHDRPLGEAMSVIRQTRQDAGR